MKMFKRNFKKKPIQDVSSVRTPEAFEEFSAGVSIDIQQLIFRAMDRAGILESMGSPHYPSSVSAFEKIISPYQDKTYRAQIKTLSDMANREIKKRTTTMKAIGLTINQAKEEGDIYTTIQGWVAERKHRRIMQLCRRKNLLPAVVGLYDEGDPSVRKS